jgi:hypothetical protein
MEVFAKIARSVPIPIAPSVRDYKSKPQFKLIIKYDIGSLLNMSEPPLRH